RSIQVTIASRSSGSCGPPLPVEDVALQQCEEGLHGGAVSARPDAPPTNRVTRCATSLVSFLLLLRRRPQRRSHQQQQMRRRRRRRLNYFVDSQTRYHTAFP